MVKLLLWLILGISFRHRHDEEIVETLRFDSPWKQIGHGKGFSVQNICSWWFASEVVTVVRCKRCGCVRHVTTIINESDNMHPTSVTMPSDESPESEEKNDSPKDSSTDS